MDHRVRSERDSVVLLKSPAPFLIENTFVIDFFGSFVEVKSVQQIVTYYSIQSFAHYSW